MEPLTFEEQLKLKYGRVADRSATADTTAIPKTEDIQSRDTY